MQNMGHAVGIVYLNFLSTSDLRNHCLVLMKLRVLGVDGRLLMQADKRSDCGNFCIRINQAISGTGVATVGEVRSSLLDPLLFVLLVNYLSTALQFSDLHITGDVKTIKCP